MISRRASSSSLVVAARDWGDASASLREAAMATRLLEAIVTSMRCLEIDRLKNEKY
jgi:hypothetical protein